MNALSTALPNYDYNQQNQPSQIQSQQLAGQVYPSNIHPYIPGYQPPIQTSAYQNQPYRGSSSPSQYHGQNLYQGQLPVFYQQYPQSGPYYQGERDIHTRTHDLPISSVNVLTQRSAWTETGNPRLPDNMMNRGYQAPLSPTWGNYPNDPSSESSILNSTLYSSFFSNNSKPLLTWRMVIVRFAKSNSKIYTISTTRPTKKTKTIRACTLGGKSSARRISERLERSFLKRCDERY